MNKIVNKTIKQRHKFCCYCVQHFAERSQVFKPLLNYMLKFGKNKFFYPVCKITID